MANGFGAARQVLHADVDRLFARRIAPLTCLAGHTVPSGIAQELSSARSGAGSAQGNRAAGGRIVRILRFVSARETRRGAVATWLRRIGIAEWRPGGKTLA